MVRSEVLAGMERRRRWSFEDKARIVEESFAPGVTVAAVARRNGVASSLVFGWRDQAKSGHLGGNGTAPMLVPVSIIAAVSEPVSATLSSQVAIAPPAEPAKPSRRRAGVIEIDLGSGRRLKVDRDVDAGALARVLDVLAKSPVAPR